MGAALAERAERRDLALRERAKQCSGRATGG